MGVLEPTSPLPPDLPPGGRPFNPVAAAVGVITNPVPAMQEIAAARPWLMALLLTIAIGLLSGLANLTNPALNPANLADMGNMTAEQRRAVEGVMQLMRPAIGAGGAIIGPIFLAVWAGILYLIARLLGGVGPYSALFSTIAFANIPSLLQVPLLLLINLGGTSLAPVASLVSFLFSIWVIVLTVIGIRESMSLSTGRSVATCSLPCGGCLLIACVIFVAMSALLVGALSGAGS